MLATPLVHKAAWAAAAPPVPNLQSGREEMWSAQQLGRSMPAFQKKAAKLPPAAALHVASMQFWRDDLPYGRTCSVGPDSTQRSLYTFMNI